MLGGDLAKIAADFEMEIEEPQASIELVNAEADLGDEECRPACRGWAYRRQGIRRCAPEEF